MALQTETNWAGYTEAQTGAALYRVSQPGYLSIGGPDRVTYIQRQSTNDMNLLTPGRTVPTVLTSGTARILDVWRLVMEPERDAIGVVTLPGRGAVTARYLQSRIFFMDKVTVADLSTEMAQFEVLGPSVRDVLDMAPAPDHIIETAIDGIAVRVVGVRADACYLLAEARHGDALSNQLRARGVAVLSEDAYEALRIEGGRPGAAHELTDDYTPLEANLDHMVSSTKGCYSGQEVIARQITYDKIARRLTGLRLEQPVTVGARVQVDGRTAGTVTSAAISPRFGAVALAVMRRPHFEPGIAVAVTGDGPIVAGRTVALPLEE